MRRILSFILFTALLVQSFAVVVLADDTNDVAITEPLSFLQSLEIMYAEKDKPEAFVSRENFAVYIARMLKINEKSFADNRYFVDLDMERYSTGVINALTERGIISQNADKEFRPTDLITGEEALKIVLCALGYGPYCEATGGFPVGYIKTAVRTELSASGEKITVAKAAELIFTAMQTPMYVVTGYSENQAQYSDDGNETVLSVYWNILFKEGTVSSVYMGSLDGSFEIEENSLSVDGTAYTVSNSVVTDDYLADYVKIFYIEDAKEIVYIIRECDKEDIEINIEDFIAIDGNNVKYYSSGKTRSMAVVNPNIIYNGMPLKAEVDETLAALKKGTVTLKDSDNDGYYDVILIKDYSTFIVSAIDSSMEKLYNGLDNTDDIKLSDYSNIRIIASNGEVREFSSVTKEMVLSVAKSKGKELLKLLIAENTGSGVLTQMKTGNGGEIRVCIDDVWYTVDKEYAAANKTMFGLGLTFNQQYTFTTDYFGDIVYLSLGSETSGKLGYLVATREEGIFDKQVFVKIFTEEGSMAIFKLGERVEIDGKTEKKLDKEKFDNIVRYGKAEIGQLVRYVAQEDELKLIDTQYFAEGLENENNTLTATFGNTDTERWYTTNRIGIMGIIDASTVAFCVPYNASSAEDKDYRVCASTAAVTNNGYYYADTYRLHKRHSVAKFMVVRYEDTTTFKNYKYNQKTFLVDEISAGLNDEGDVVTLLSGYENGSKIEYKVDPSELSFDAVEKGDLLQLSYDVHGNPVKSTTDRNGYITLYDRAAGGLPNPSVWSGMDEKSGRVLYALSTNQSQEYYNAEFQLSFGYVSDVYEGVVSWGWRDPKNVSECANCSSIPVIIIEKTEKDVQVYKGTTDDIQGYEDAGSNCSRVIYHTYGNSGRAIYVYK